MTQEDKASLTGQSTGQNYTYILRCADGSLYTGWTNDLEKRLQTHNAGKGGKYTRTHRPVELVYSECFPTRQEAMRREVLIKQMSRREKLQLIDGSSTVPAEDPGREAEGQTSPENEKKGNA